MSKQLTVKFNKYYSSGSYTRTGNKDSRGVIEISQRLRDASYYGHEMVVEELGTTSVTYYTHRIIKCDQYPDIVGRWVHKNFIMEVIPKEKIKLTKVWGE